MAPQRQSRLAVSLSTPIYDSFKQVSSWALVVCLSWAVASATALPQDNSKAKIFLMFDRINPSGVLVIGRGPKLPVYLDDKKIGALRMGEYMIVETAPGRHTLRSRGGKSSMGIEVEPSKEYFIRMEYAAAAFRGRAVLLEMDSERGRANLVGLKLVEPK